MSRFVIVAALSLLAFVLGVVNAAGAAQPVTESATSGGVTITLTYSYDRTAASYDATYKNLALTIDRGGARTFDAPLHPVCQGCLVWPASAGNPARPSVHVSDLDVDGEQDPFVDLYTGGAHCCEYTIFFRWAGEKYVSTVHDWGNPGYRSADPNHDGRAEFVTADDRFNYAFACFACSGVPIVILRYRALGLVDVTRRFPALIRADAARLWRGYRRAVRERYYPSGVLPAYLADEIRLGRSRQGWARVRRAVALRSWPAMVDPRWRNRGRYLRAVSRFLRATGYVH